MTDEKIARLNESIRLTLADAQERCDRNETLPLECGRAVVKVARIAFDLCHEQASDLAALRERLAAAEKRAETAEALVRELAAVAKAARYAVLLLDVGACSFKENGKDYEAFGLETIANGPRSALAALSPAARKEIER